MSDALQSIRKRLSDYQSSPKGYGTGLRHDVAAIIVQRLEELNWTQRDLAKAMGKPESFVSRLIHRNANCELETVGEVLHALGVKPSIVAREVLASSCLPSPTEAAGSTDEESHGNAEVFASTQTQFVNIYGTQATS